MLLQSSTGNSTSPRRQNAERADSNPENERNEVMYKHCFA